MQMLLMKRMCIVVASTLLPALAWSAQADKGGTYPTKPTRLIVPLTAGGPTDTLARIIAIPLGEALGQAVIVDNRPGAGGNIGADIAAKAPPDGYTLFMGTSGPLAINSTLYSKLPFDPIRDFAPVILVASAPFVVIVNSSLPANSLKELIALAKAKPGQLNYGSVSGSASHLSTELFKMTSGVNLMHIPYKGAAPATTDVMAGQIQLSFASTPGAVPVVTSGKVKALAVTSLKRVAKLPDVPTVAEAALPGYEAGVWYGVVAPARTPTEVVRRLNKEIARIVAEPVHRNRMLSGDFEPTTSTPEQFAAFIKSETTKWGKVVKASGAKAE